MGRLPDRRPATENLLTMHELSIALNIIDIIDETCRNEKDPAVREIVIRVGDLSGVDTEALSTCLHIASRNTLLQEAHVRILRQPGTGWCAHCRKEFPMEDILTPCPECFQPASELREGREMQIDSIVVE